MKAPMKNPIILPVLIFALLVSCSQIQDPDSIKPQKAAANTPSALTPSPTLLPTLTPLPDLPAAQSAPEALYTPIKLSAEDEQVYQKALNDIPLYRQGNIQVKITGENGNPLTGYKVTYRQSSHDFIFGSVIVPGQTSKLSETGINYWDFQTQWPWIQPQDGRYTFNFLNYWQSLDEIRSAGYKTMASGLFIMNEADGNHFFPPFWKDLPFDQFLQKEYEFISRTAKEIGPAIDVWESIGEPNFVDRNPLRLDKDQYYQAISTSSKAIRDNDPTAVIEVNLGVPCGEISWNTNSEIIQGLLERKIDFDQAGLQFYNNSYANNHYYMGKDTLAEMSRCWDDYEKLLTPNNKKMNMTEMSVSSDHRGNELGYWDVPWTEETQAQYLETFYTIFFAKPANTGLTWYFSMDAFQDADPFVMYKGGLIRDDGTPKKSFYALKNLIQRWSTNGEAVTGPDGIITFRGFGGDYDLLVTNPVTGESMHAVVHVTDQKSSSETMPFVPNKQLLEQKGKLEKLAGYWEKKSNTEFVQKGHDYLALADHHLRNAEWALAEQTISAGLDELAITTELDIPVTSFKIASQDTDVPIIDGGRVVLWGSDTLYYPYDFPAGRVSVEIQAHSQAEKGEVPYMITGIGANYSDQWKVENTSAAAFAFSALTTGREKVFTIRCPYIDRINKSILSQNGNTGEIKLFIDRVKLVIKTSEVP